MCPDRTGEALVSRKVVCREASTEGSETTKSGTDEQKQDKRHNYPGKQAQLCNTPRIPKGTYVDPAVIGRRKTLLPGEVSVLASKSREVSRGHSSCSNEPKKEPEDSQAAKD